MTDEIIIDRQCDYLNEVLKNDNDYECCVGGRCNYCPFYVAKECNGCKNNMKANDEKD